jgi:uncharacterized membrane protein YfcA
MELDGLRLLLFLASALVAEVIGTMAGFGAATILTPIAALFMDIKTAIVFVACFHLFGNASRLSFFGRRVRWDIWMSFGIAGIACSFLGAHVTTRLSSDVVRVAFGTFLLLFVVCSVVPVARFQLPCTRVTLVGGGILSGFIAGLIGTGGAVRSACLLAWRLPTEAYLGTSAAIALVVDATRVPVYLADGLLRPGLAPVLAALVAVAFAGAWVGQRIVRRLHAEIVRRLVLALLALMGLKLVADGWHGLV